jgi:hypothetical protein
MTVLGWILLVFCTLGLLSLLNYGAKEALRIDRWRDLFHRKA